MIKICEQDCVQVVQCWNADAGNGVTKSLITWRFVGLVSRLYYSSRKNDGFDIEAGEFLSAFNEVVFKLRSAGAGGSRCPSRYHRLKEAKVDSIFMKDWGSSLGGVDG